MDGIIIPNLFINNNRRDSRLLKYYSRGFDIALVHLESNKNKLQKLSEMDIFQLGKLNCCVRPSEIKLEHGRIKTRIKIENVAESNPTPETEIYPHLMKHGCPKIMGLWNRECFIRRKDQSYHLMTTLDQSSKLKGSPYYFKGLTEYLVDSKVNKFCGNEMLTIFGSKMILMLLEVLIDGENNTFRPVNNFVDVDVFGDEIERLMKPHITIIEETLPKIEFSRVSTNWQKNVDQWYSQIKLKSE